jgi:hypothetical protein
MAHIPEGFEFQHMATTAGSMQSEEDREDTTTTTSLTSAVDPEQILRLVAKQQERTAEDMQRQQQLANEHHERLMAMLERVLTQSVQQKASKRTYNLEAEKEMDLDDDISVSEREPSPTGRSEVSSRSERRREQLRRMTLTPRRINSIQSQTRRQESGPVHMVPILQWPEFKGEKDEDPVRFLSEFEEIADLERKGQEEKLLVLARCLKGRATVVSDWIRTSVAAEHNISYEDAQKRLLSIYGKRYQANNLYQDFFRMRQKREETAGEYLLRLQAAANLLDRNFSEEEITYRFVDGLRPELYSHMRDKEFSNYERALKSAEKLE